MLNAKAQTTVMYRETFGFSASTKTIAAHTGWSDTARYRGTADIRSTLPSTGSGGSNCFFTSTSGTHLVISGLNTMQWSNLCLDLYMLKSTNGSNGSQLIIEWSSDSINWTRFTNTLPTGSGTTNVWYTVKDTCSILPQCSNLRLRFRQTSNSVQFRIDDVRLTGIKALPLSLDLTSFTVRSKGDVNFIEFTTISNTEEIVTLLKSKNLNGWLPVTTIPVSPSSYEQTFQINDRDDGLTYYVLEFTSDGIMKTSKVIAINRRSEFEQPQYFYIDGRQTTKRNGLQMISGGRVIQF